MKIEIVEDIKQRMKIDDSYVKEVLHGRKIDKKKAEKTLIITPEVFAKIFSPQRIKLMLAIKRNKIKNIYQLAKQLERKYEAVYRDIKLLEGLGLITLKTKEKQRIPCLETPIKIPEFL